jgi:hypothetical protein
MFGECLVGCAESSVVWYRLGVVTDQQAEDGKTTGSFNGTQKSVKAGGSIDSKDEGGWQDRINASSAAGFCTLQMT